VVLNLLWTIDTDSFLIELLQQARRETRSTAANSSDNNGSDTANTEELTILCLREPSRKRKNEPVTPASFLCIDMRVFHDSVMRYVFGTNVHIADLQRRRRHTAALFAASVALCGCDFVQVQGLRCDLMLPCIRDVARNEPDMLELMSGVFTGHAGEVRKAEAAIRAVVENYITSISGVGGHMIKTHSKASAYSDLQILRACWITSYWLAYEFKDVNQWGFSAMESPPSFATTA
jgi:hypothetical protein